MSTGAGKDRADYVNFNPHQYHDDDNPHKAMGCHKGGFAGLNVINPQPEMYYGWGNDDRRGVLSARHKGYRLVSRDNPARAAYDNILGFDHQDLDSSSGGFPGVVFMERTARDERRVRAEELKKHHQLLRGGQAEERFQAGATAQEKLNGAERFQRKDHRTYSTATSDAEGDAIQAWTPGRGNSS